MGEKGKLFTYPLLNFLIFCFISGYRVSRTGGGFCFFLFCATRRRGEFAHSRIRTNRICDVSFTATRRTVLPTFFFPQTGFRSTNLRACFVATAVDPSHIPPTIYIARGSHYLLRQGRESETKIFISIISWMMTEVRWGGSSSVAVVLVVERWTPFWWKEEEEEGPVVFVRQSSSRQPPST